MIGSRQWMEHSHGKLSLKEKYKMIQTTIIPTTYTYIKRYFNRSPKNMPHDVQQLDLSHIELPDSTIIQQATASLNSCRLNAIIQHAWRCFYWAIALSKWQQWRFDQEGFLIACLMHKLGLTDKLLPEACHCFTYASALQAEQLCHLQHYPESKTQNIANAICLQLNSSLPPPHIQRSHEVRLLQQATACDVYGLDLNHIPHSFQQQLLQRHPRHDFNHVINQLYQREAQRNPNSRCALLRRFGLSLMIKHNGFST